MFKHYLATALRHFHSHKLTTSINVVCLTIGLVCFLAIYATVAYFSHSDRFYANADRTYMINQKGGWSVMAPTATWGTAKYLKVDAPELEAVARVTVSAAGVVGDEVPITAGDKKGFMRVAYADPEFLQIFALPFLAGDSRNALRAPRSAILSDSTATHFFGSTANALGKMLRLQDGSEVIVRGVLGKLQQPSEFSTEPNSVALIRFDVMLSMDVYESEAAHDIVKKTTVLDWASPLFATYAMLPKSGFTLDELRLRLNQLGPKHADTQLTKHRFVAVPVSNYLLKSLGAFSGEDKTGIPVTALFYFLGAVVLLASCLNYANLATAQATTRAKEIGLRRTVGARTSQIMLQFLFEAALTSFAALLLAISLIAIALLLVPIGGIAAVIVSVVSSWSFWTMLCVLLFVVTISAGAYPSFILSRVRPTQAIRAGATHSGGRFTQRVLVIVQFTAAGFLLIVVLAMQLQNAEFKRLALSNMADPFVVISNNIQAANIEYEVFRTELLKRPNVQAVTAAVFSPWVLIAGNYSVGASSEPTARKLATVRSAVHYDYFDTLGIHVLAGRVFDRMHMDVAEQARRESSDGVANVVIDRALAEQNGWVTPNKALGKMLYDFTDNETSPVPYRVIGVVENRPLSIVSVGATSNMYVLAPAISAYPIIRVSKLNAVQGLKDIQAVWNQFAPNVALKMKFSDEIVAAQFRSFDIIGNIFFGVATLAFAISILGLIGLSFHVINRRRREIGVRKTLGASVPRIVALLVRDFSIPVVLANIAAWPVAYLILRIYVSIFTQHAALSPTPFLAGLVITVLVAWLAVSTQTTRAARMNPATVLRHE